MLGVIGATENLPSGTAVKPGDIIRALDGTTVEVNNTDAEGRLVLADCISYARREGAERLVDVATLTGGIVVALGSTYAGLMSNDDAWASRSSGRRERTGELVWRMPLHREYAEMIKGRYGQIVNSTTKREATALTAGEFLHHFAGDVPWAHIDIAGTAWDVSRPYYADKGATGSACGCSSTAGDTSGRRRKYGRTERCHWWMLARTQDPLRSSVRESAAPQAPRMRRSGGTIRIRLTKLRSAPTRP